MEDVRSEFLDGTGDIVIFSESWLHPNVSDCLLHVEGYNCLRFDRQVEVAQGQIKKGGGICAYLKDTPSYEIHSSLNISNADLELFTFSIIRENQKRLNILSLYRPPTGNLQNALTLIKEAIESIKLNYNGEYLVIGDVNVDMIKSNHQSRKIDQVMSKKSLRQIITGPTRITCRTSSLIDIAYTDISNIKDSGTVNSNISDHLPIFLIKKKERVKKNKIEIVARSYKNLCIESFNRDIQDIDNDFIFSQTDPNEIWKKLHAHIVAVIEKYCPEKKIRVTEDRPKYLNEELLLLMKARRTKLESDWVTARKLRSQVQSGLVKAKKDYILGQIEAANGDNQKFWAVIQRTFLNSKKNEVCQIRNPISGEVLRGGGGIGRQQTP